MTATTRSARRRTVTGRRALSPAVLFVGVMQRKLVRILLMCVLFFFSSRRRHTRLQGDWEFRRVLFRSGRNPHAVGFTDAFLQLGVDFSANPWWTLSGGVELSACSVALDIFGIGGGLDCPDDLIQQLQLSFPIGRASGGFLPSDTTPSITSITPDSVAAGSSGVTLTLTGANFAPGATLNFNGAA